MKDKPDGKTTLRVQWGEGSKRPQPVALLVYGFATPLLETLRVEGSRAWWQRGAVGLFLKYPGACRVEAHPYAPDGEPEPQCLAVFYRTLR